ncbi:MAG: hypothetical protein AB1545_17085 [Thermodesulfobacteriota bacterium]
MLNALAVLLLILSPWLEEVHLAGSRHDHDFYTSHETTTSGHQTCCHEPGFSDVQPFSGKGHDAHHCPICQSLRVLGTPFSLPAPPSLILPFATDRVLLSSLDDNFISHFQHSIQARAPPSV